MFQSLEKINKLNGNRTDLFLSLSFSLSIVVVFQYSSSHSLEKVKKEDFDSCNTTNAARTFTNGNTTVPLTEPGTRYFVCGNQLHCLGGMKLQVNVEDNHANPPIGAPQAQPAGGALTQPSSKSNNPASAIPTSAGSVYGGRDCIVMAFLGFVATMFWVVQV